ncbi:hypothetical protein BDZ90DRAFT_228233 [Jaminaea rosea]|uniref:Secreted protein n=1 Tax=Jaminaea rosea TaxID=1569628 RepID=A0A316UM59_9BASI|nr:hypothetical protein BDZ90DRAFT_228233 [Jaminaea rosea]PWN25461.1 hypothetical protein BDZ90DRAFT_228233 [Jaminaea rosea]
MPINFKLLTAVLVGLAHLGIKTVLGYCWPSELKCSGVKTRTVTGKLPGANAIGDCQSFASAHPVVDGCINSDCTGGCDAMNVKPHACIEDTRAYKCLVFAPDPKPPSSISDRAAVRGAKEPAGTSKLQ